MSSDITVRDLASMAIDEDVVCQIWTPQQGTVLTVRLKKLSIQPMRIGKLIISKLKMAYLL